MDNGSVSSKSSENAAGANRDNVTGHFTMTLNKYSKTLFLATIIATVFSFRQDSRNIDKELFGTWYSFHDGRIQYFAFNSDGTFEFNYQNSVVNKAYFQKKGLESSLTYTTYRQKTSPHKLIMNLRVTTLDTTKKLTMSGIYQLINDSSLKIDLASDSEVPKTSFTKTATILTKTKDITTLIRKHQSSAYLFTKNSADGITVDTIKPSDKDYRYIDSVYRKIVTDKK